MAGDYTDIENKTGVARCSAHLRA